LGLRGPFQRLELVEAAAGAAAYLTKGCSAHDLLEAVLELGYCNLAQESHTESEVVAQT